MGIKTDIERLQDKIREHEAAAEFQAREDERARLRCQRDTAWRALEQIERALSGLSNPLDIPSLAFILAGAVDMEGAADYAGVIEAMDAEESTT